jgi:phage replication-related protein YjqB (UPF0714/DUF867 family)
MSPPIVTLPLVDVPVCAGEPPNGADRKEHCVLAADLRRELGVAIGSQIRVGFPFQSGGTAAGNTANFTIYADGDADSGLQLFSNTSPDPNVLGGKNGGVYKLYRLGGQQPLPADLATVWSVAPSETRTDGDVLAGDKHFDEPSADPANHFRELVHTGGADHRVILLVPHGGAIDRHTSEQIEPFRRALAPTSPTIWGCRGAWRGQAAARWHIRADYLHERSFPGLWRILHEEAPYRTGVHFRYAVALHGFQWDNANSKRGIILGGMAPHADKHRVMVGIKIAIANDDALGPAEVDRVAFYIASTRGIAGNAYPAPNQGWDTDFHFESKAGMSPKNIVNRLSSSVGAILDGHRGGIQLEQSTAVRLDKKLRAAVARGVAAAINDLLNQPPL